MGCKKKFSSIGLLSVSFFFFLFTQDLPAKVATKTLKFELPQWGLESLDKSALAKTTKQSQRKPSGQNRISEENLTVGFKKFREEFLSAVTAEQLETLLDKSQAHYEDYPPEVQYFVAQMQIVRPLRGIVYRMIPLVESSNAFRSAASTQLKSIASILRIYLPTQQWQGRFDFFVSPSVNASDNRQFVNVSEFQAYVSGVILPAFVEAKKRIFAIYSKQWSTPFIWDNKMWFGVGSFGDDLDRYRVHGPAEMAMSLANLSSSIQSMAVFCAYDLDDTVKVVRDLGYLEGVDGFKFSALFGNDMGVSSEQRVTHVFNKYKNFLTLRKELDGTYAKRMLEMAFTQVKDAVYYYDLAWKHLESGAADEFALLDPAIVKPSKRSIDLQINTWKDLINGKTSLRSPITGEVVEVDLPNFYLNPPKDLKSLFPVAFDQSPKHLKVTSATGEEMTYRNYFRGSPILWDSKAWSPYLKVNDPSKGSSMATGFRILSNHGGAGLVSYPLNAIVH